VIARFTATGIKEVESQLEKVFRYVKNQKEHHAKKSFQHEYDEFLKLYGLEQNG